MTFEFSSNYYVLRRQVLTKIREKLESYPPNSVDHDELMLDLRIFARELSNESGLSPKLVHKLFAQRGIVLEEVRV